MDTPFGFAGRNGSGRLDHAPRADRPELTARARDIRTTSLRRRPERRAVGHRPAGLNVDVDRHRFESVAPNFDAVRSGFEVHLLKRSVEVVDNSHVVAVDEDFGVALIDGDPDAAISSARCDRHIARVSVTMGRNRRGTAMGSNRRR